MGVAEYEARGLYDPKAPNAAERLALLEWLAGQGVTVEQMVDAQARDRLTGIAGDLALRPGERLTLTEVVEQTGLSDDEVRQLSLTAGIALDGIDDPVFTPTDVEIFKLFGVGAEFFGEEPLRQFTRVIGSSLGRVADAAVSLFLADVESPLDEAHAGELALAKANLEAIGALSGLPYLMDAVLRAHMELAIQRSQEARAEATSKVTAILAVGFVDLVGFTPLSQRVPVAELRTLVDDFEGTAYDTVATYGGRVVKLIGDEVMFVALKPADACEIALSLVDRFAEPDSNVTPRGGLAVGEILTRGGDYYGPVVNLASRIADLAVPNEILVTRDLRERAEKSSAPLSFDPAGRRMLKGFDEPVELFALRRA